MIKFLLVAALVPVLAPLEWTHWDFPKDYSLGCYKDISFIDEVNKTHGTMNGCRLMGEKQILFGANGLYFEEMTVGSTPYYSVCGKPVEEGEFDIYLIVWKAQDYPTYLCDIKPDSKIAP